MTRQVSMGWETRWRSKHVNTCNAWPSYPAGGSFAEGLGYMLMDPALFGTNPVECYYFLEDEDNNIFIQCDVYSDGVCGGGTPEEDRSRIIFNDVGVQAGYVEVTDLQERLKWAWGTGSGEKAYTVSGWHRVHVWAYINPGAGNDRLQMWVDGVLEFDIDQDLALTATLFDQVVLYGYRTNCTGQVTRARWDNFVVNLGNGAVDNSMPWDRYFVGLPDTADGDVIQLDRGGVDSGANWSQVEEIPPAGTEWVYKNEQLFRDMYVATNTPAQVDGLPYDVSAVYTKGRHRLSSTNPALGIYPGVKTEGVEYDGDFDNPGTSWTPFAQRWRLNPNTLALWTTVQVDAAQPGIEVV